MSRVLDVPKNMSEYLLKGWILTNESCPRCSMPRMRSPQHTGESKLLCVNCNESEGGQEDPTEILSVSTASDVLSRDGVSTPPTDVSPPPSPPFVLPPPSQETLVRRAQSDRASREIGNRMLRGWTMLADECINPTCYGVPLVRSPGGNPVKECVICGNRYVPEGSSTVLLPKGPTSAATVPNASSTSTSKAKASETPAAIGAKMNNSSPSPKALTLEQGSTTLATVSFHLKESLRVLDGLLVASTAAEDVERIGAVAESMSKVVIAMKTVSTV